MVNMALKSNLTIATQSFLQTIYEVCDIQSVRAIEKKKIEEKEFYIAHLEVIDRAKLAHKYSIKLSATESVIIVKPRPIKDKFSAAN